MYQRLATPFFALVAISTALSCSDVATKASVPTDPIYLIGGDCYTPTSAALAVDSTAIFFKTGADCTAGIKRKATVTWSNPQTPVRAGMGVDQTCASQVDYRTGILKVTRCATGLVTLTIYSDSAGTSVVQTIPIDDDP